MIAEVVRRNRQYAFVIAIRCSQLNVGAKVINTRENLVDPQQLEILFVGLNADCCRKSVLERKD